MNYKRYFEEAIAQVQAEKRYRVFAELERIAGAFPRALWRSDGATKEIVVWCSNDYLGMGQHPDVIAPCRRRPAGWEPGGRHAQHFRAPTARWWSWRPSLPIFTASNRRWLHFRLRLKASISTRGSCPLPRPVR